jgi:hypothetical protein
LQQYEAVPRRAHFSGSKTCVSLNSSLESNKEEEKTGSRRWLLDTDARKSLVFKRHRRVVDPRIFGQSPAISSTARTTATAPARPYSSPLVSSGGPYSSPLLSSAGPCLSHFSETPTHWLPFVGPTGPGRAATHALRGSSTGLGFEVCWSLHSIRGEGLELSSRGGFLRDPPLVGFPS